MSLIGVEGRNCALLPPLHVIGFFTVGFVVVVVRFAGGGDFFGGGDLGLHDISVLQFVVVHEVAWENSDLTAWNSATDRAP